ncbi:fatty acyl-AMP ligase [Streptomyces sp. NPDC052701]|uniref:fatty acyl-AMP ligase n=1 Tax=Streptomyces sp. NPDC052701 TaxID=3155533 RepID=UPI00341C277D
MTSVSDLLMSQERQDDVSPVHRHPGGSTLTEVLRWGATHYADRTVCLTLGSDGGEKDSVTFAELDLRARAVAAALRGAAGPGARALLLLPPGLDFLTAFFACSYAGVIAVPVPSPDGPFGVQRLRDRLGGIVDDCAPSVVLTTRELAADGRDGAAVAGDVPRLVVQDVDPEMAWGWRDSGSDGDTVALLQYTSGSTSAPKGVVLTQRNVTENLAAIAGGLGEDAGGSADFTCVTWLPPFHDMGLAALLLPCYLGGRSVVMSPMTFLMNPLLWLKSIDRYQARLSPAPNFAYDLCVERITPEQRQLLDLSRWKFALSGAEPVRAATLSRFAAAFTGCGFRTSAFLPSYGLAEANVYVSGGRRPGDSRVIRARTDALENQGIVLPATADEPSRALVGLGRLPANLHARIVDPETRLPCPEGSVGEIWLAGANVAQGYWGKPEATAGTFGGRLADSGEGPYLRTHDLGFLKDGQLFVTGRTDDLIIVDGRNVHPHDVEVSVEDSHAAVAGNRVAVFGWQDGGETRVGVVAEIARQYRITDGAGTSPRQSELSREEITRAVRNAVSETHQVPVTEVVLLKPGGLPRTTSGKVQRREARRLLLEGGLNAW